MGSGKRAYAPRLSKAVGTRIPAFAGMTTVMATVLRLVVTPRRGAEFFRPGGLQGRFSQARLTK
jgi:hypothetical protein